MRHNAGHSNYHNHLDNQIIEMDPFQHRKTPQNYKIITLGHHQTSHQILGHKDPPTSGQHPGNGPDIQAPTTPRGSLLPQCETTSTISMLSTHNYRSPKSKRSSTHHNSSQKGTIQYYHNKHDYHHETNQCAWNFVFETSDRHFTS